MNEAFASSSTTSATVRVTFADPVLLSVVRTSKAASPSGDVAASVPSTVSDSAPPRSATDEAPTAPPTTTSSTSAACIGVSSMAGRAADTDIVTMDIPPVSGVLGAGAPRRHRFAPPRVERE